MARVELKINSVAAHQLRSLADNLIEFGQELDPTIGLTSFLDNNDTIMLSLVQPDTLQR